jgi:hypothetical protein
LTIDEDQFHALPGEAKQRINDFIEDTVSRYRAQLHMKSKKAGQR